ncbi:MAG: DUF2029 domain-containing protein [Candidatus Helarchaeota archaeon]|nr:DUF2029 domain-containing protein [Candidatus Helarchaeota archaeon]
MASEKTHTAINYVILISIPIAIFIAIITGDALTWTFESGITDILDHYLNFEKVWIAILTGVNPYTNPSFACPYPIGFLAFSGLFHFYKLLPKIFFCLIWLLTAYVINRICKEYNITDKSTILFCVFFIILNPMYLSTTMLQGWYDGIVGLSILLAVYAIDHSKQIKSGIYAALAFLFKFIGLIVLFPIVFVKKKINWRTGITAASICGGLYLFAYLLWGNSAFYPFWLHLFRDPEGASIFVIIYDIFGIDLSKYIIYLLIIGVFIVIGFLYFQNNDISTYSLIIIILFILILPVFWGQYMLWFIPLAIYWSITHNYALKGTFSLYLCALILLLHFYYVTSIFTIITYILSLVFVLLVYLNRNKDELNEQQPDNLDEDN